MADFRLKRSKSSEQKQAVAPDPETSKSLLSQAGGGAMSGLHTVGSILSTPSRVLWGSINGLTGGEGGFGNMNPLDSTGGIELSHVLGNAGVIAKNDPNKWEWGDLGRGLVDIAGDPTSWAGVGGLTKAGVAASKAGRLTPGLVNSVRAGERGLLSFHHPLATVSHGAIGTGAAVGDALHAAGARTGVTRLANAVAASAPVTKIKQLFHASSLGRTTPATQHMAEQAYHETTGRLRDADLGAINATRNIQARGPIGGDTERHLAELGTPTREMRPLLAAKDAIHAEAQHLGIPTGNLDNDVKAFTKIGPKKALLTKILDDQGNIAHTIVNQGAHNEPVNFLRPNTAVQHVPRFAGEGVEWGGLGAEYSSKAMSAQSAINQHRNADLLGNAQTEVIEQGLRSASGLQPRLAAAGLSENRQARALGKFIKKQVIARDVGAGTNLTRKTSVSGREVDRTRELGNLLQRNPQIADTGLFTNDPIFDIHHQMSSLSNTIPKADAATDFMAHHAAISHNEPLDVLRGRGLDNPPTIRDAASQLGVSTARVGDNVLARLPAQLATTLRAEAAREATRVVSHTHAGQTPAQIAAQYARIQPAILHNMVLDLHLPSAEYKSLTGFLEKAPASKGGFFKSLNTMWKANMLAHPATQVRNAVSAGVTNTLEGSTTPFSQSTRHAIDLIRGQEISGYAHVPEIRHLMSSQNISETEAIRRLAATHFPVNHSIAGDLPADQAGAQLADLASNVPGRSFTPASEAVMGPLRALAGFRDGQHVGRNVVNPAAIGGAFGHETTSFGPAMASNMVARNVEQPMRIGGWLGLMRQGYSADEAARLVGRAQVNYGSREFSEFEKQLKNVIPFYSFSSRAGKHVATELASNPGGRMAQLVKAQDRAHAQDPSLPDSVLSGTALPLGTRADGTKTFATGLGLAHEPAVHTLGALAHGDLRGAGYDILGMTNPLLKTPLEHVTGQSFFQRGEPAGNLDPTVGRLMSNAGVLTGLRDPEAGPVKYPGSSIVEPLVGSSPLSRYATTARTLTDTRKSLPESLVNVLTGARITDVSPKKQAFTLMKRAEDLAKSQGAHSRSEVYFSKAELENLDKTDPVLAKKQRELQALLNAVKSKSAKKPKEDSKGDFRLRKTK